MSLTSDDLADIKQLMTSVVRAEVRSLQGEVGSLRSEFGSLREEMNQRFAEQDEKLNEIMNAVGGEFSEHADKIDDHERRIYRLEQKAA